jgi:hypothetical protein
MQARVDQLIATSTETFHKQRHDRFDEIADELQSKATTATNNVREDAEALAEELKTETPEGTDRREVVQRRESVPSRLRTRFLSSLRRHRGTVS